MMFKNTISKFDFMDAYKTEKMAAIAGLGIYSLVAISAPTMLFNFAKASSNILSGALGSSIGMSIGYILPIATIVAASVLVAKLMMHIVKEMLKHSLSKQHLSGRATIDAMEQVSNNSMSFLS